MDDDISMSIEYQTFRASISLKRVIVDSNVKHEWIFYDAGPRNVKCPLLCLPPVSGTADVYFQQIHSLSMLGYRVISVDYPEYWTLEDFCTGLNKFINYLQLDMVHLFGASLGGYLCQKFAVLYNQRVASIILCNTFNDTSVFQHSLIAKGFWTMPAFFLRSMIMSDFSRYNHSTGEISKASNFMNLRLKSLPQRKLASRLQLNCEDSYIEPQSLRGTYITLIDVFDTCALGDNVREEMYKCYPDARRAHLKTGGDFPYISRAEDTNLYIQIHLQTFEGTASSPHSSSQDSKIRTASILNNTHRDSDDDDTVHRL